ncbi:MAG: undecaprenyldiphospho-muramoylpentapeptide beta-N-acetylglucosaminyltransferase [Ignavibacteria bacterium]|nr:undecaprenyldiphospho-muramoylpentapeptide beta-N-acetylglucosaminyltransferase [Ignavibacteria bacterium]
MRVIFAGGGTGGHLFPAIAIADHVRRLVPDAEILFVGTHDKIEARVVPSKGFAFRSIWISGFHRGLRLSNLLFPLKVIVSSMQARSIIKSFNPDVVVGTGGYVSGPVLRAATVAGIPTIIQEQNSYPGVTTRILAKKVNEVHLTFESSKKYFQRSDNLIVSGNPTREDLERVNIQAALTYFGFKQGEHVKTVLVFGGSLGAHSINKAIERHLDELIKHRVRVIWQTGTEDYSHARNLCRTYSTTDVWVNAFIDRMDYAYAVADIVVCRAGATTIAELTRLGKPAILVPYPHAAANHQVENAESLAQSGAAVVVYDHEVSEKISTVVLSLLAGVRLQEMGEKSKKLGKPEAARAIAQRVVELARLR